MNHPMQNTSMHCKCSSNENKNERAKKNEQVSVSLYNHSFLSMEGADVEEIMFIVGAINNVKNCVT